jgi:hypothetical protein
VGPDILGKINLVFLFRTADKTGYVRQSISSIKYTKIMNDLHLSKQESLIKEITFSVSFDYLS